MIEFYVGEHGIAPTKVFGDAGFDFYVPSDFISCWIIPGDDILINTKIRSKFPENRALIAFNKSGVATKKQLQVGACVVDSSYQGEIHIHLYNWGTKSICIESCDKLVQFVPIKIEPREAKFTDGTYTSVENFYGTVSDRGEGGFGSTGDKI